MTTTQLEEITLTDLVPYDETDNPHHKSHIVSNKGNEDEITGAMTAQDLVDMARMGQFEVVALCGYRFVPKHNPEKHEICPACLKIFNATA